MPRELAPREFSWHIISGKSMHRNQRVLFLFQNRTGKIIPSQFGRKNKKSPHFPKWGGFFYYQ
tara:strand:- start:705 stop:893 length:189 start_codon:yes stop_codon:yes gene_type:complete